MLRGGESGKIVRDMSVALMVMSLATPFVAAMVRTCGPAFSYTLIGSVSPDTRGGRALPPLIGLS